MAKKDKLNNRDVSRILDSLPKPNNLSSVIGSTFLNLNNENKD